MGCASVSALLRAPRAIEWRLAMTVAHILKSKGNAVYTVEQGQRLADVAQILSKRKIGALVVVDARGNATGILGEREIVAAISRHGAAALLEPAQDHMVTRFDTCRRTDSIESLMDAMTSSRLRHIPVVEDGILLGIVSIGDVVKHRIAETEHEAESLREYITTAR
jgi:CBS domain-containing protein